MADETRSVTPAGRGPWWKSLGPALITACVVFGPGSLLVSSKVGATYGCELVWFLVMTGVLMGTFLTMGARIGVVGGATPCSLLARELGRPAAAVIGITLCLICSAFQFANNLAFAAAAGAFLDPKVVPWVVVAVNALVILFLFFARHIYRILERMMKVMVGVIFVCFLFNLVVARPDLLAIVQGLIPRFPEGVELAFPHMVDGKIVDPMILVAALLGTTFSVGGAFYQGNLVRERGWTITDYRNSVGDSIAGVSVLTCVSLIILITSATVILGKPAEDVGQLALSLEPLLGRTAFWIFSIGLIAVATNPFMINAMIGGSILADGFGIPARLSDRGPRFFTVAVLLVGMGVALVALHGGGKPAQPVTLIIFGQALTVLGNPLMAAAILYLANSRRVMGERRNPWWVNVLGGLGFVVVLFMACRVLWGLLLKAGWVG
jgi:manganese transport protein